MGWSSSPGSGARIQSSLPFQTMLGFCGHPIPSHCGSGCEEVHIQCWEMELKWHRAGVWAPSSFLLSLKPSPSAGVIPSCLAGVPRNCCWQHLGILKMLPSAHNQRLEMRGLRFAGLQTEEPIPGSCSAPAEHQEVCPALCEVRQEVSLERLQPLPGAFTPPRCCYVPVVNYSLSLKE